MERIVLTQPEVTPQVVTTGYGLSGVVLQVDPQPLLVVHLVGTNGERREIRYEGAGASQRLYAINAVALIGSLLQMVIDDGHVVGSVVNEP